VICVVVDFSRDNFYNPSQSAVIRPNMEYGIVVNNKFALFDDEDEDPLEALQRAEEEAAKKSKTATKENTAASKKVAAKNAKNTTSKTSSSTTPSTAAKTDAKQPAKVLAPAQEQKAKAPAQNLPPRRDNAAEKPPRFRQQQNENDAQRRPPRADNWEQQPAKTDSEFRPERTERGGDDFHGRGGFVRRGRGGRGGGGSNEGGFDRFGKREFERHSGSDRTGLKPVEKREGGGAHNWGTIADAVAEQEQLAANPTIVNTTADADTTKDTYVFFCFQLGCKCSSRLAIPTCLL
jgi:plasminogen activator inhibitor 1 RNA-binding protein